MAASYDRQRHYTANSLVLLSSSTSNYQCEGTIAPFITWEGLGKFVEIGILGCGTGKGESYYTNILGF